MIDYRENNKWTVYVHIVSKEISGNLNDKYYVGITSQLVKRRWRNGEGYKNNTYFYRAIKKYKWENIQHEIIAENLTKEEACNFEIQLINRLDTQNPFNGYNISSGGEVNNGWKMSNETCKQMSDRFSGGNNPNSVKIYQYSLKCDFIKEFLTIQDAATEVNVSYGGLVKCANNLNDTAGGYRWSFEKVDRLPPLAYIKIKSIIQYDRYFNIINVFKSANQASKETGYDKSCILEHCRNWKVYKNYYWIFEIDKEQFEKENNLTDVEARKSLFFI